MTIPPNPNHRTIKPLPRQCAFVSYGVQCRRQPRYTLPYYSSVVSYCPFHAGWHAFALSQDYVLWCELREVVEDE